MADDKEVKALTSTVEKLTKAQAKSVKTFKEKEKQEFEDRKAAATNLRDLKNMMEDASDENQNILKQYFEKGEIEFVKRVGRDEKGRFTSQADFADGQAFTGTGGLEKVIENAVKEAEIIIGRQEEGVEISKADKEQLKKLAAIEKAAQTQIAYAEEMKDETTLDAFKKYFGSMGDFKQFLGNLKDSASDRVTKIKDKIKDGFDFIFDIIKLGLALFGGLTALSGFINGWNKVNDWFSEKDNPTIGDRIAAGLAGIVQAFTGISDEEAAKKANQAAFYINGIINFFSRIVAAFGNITGLRDRKEGESLITDTALVVGSLLALFGPKGMIGKIGGFLLTGFLTLAGVIATALGIPVAAAAGIILAIGVVLGLIVYYWDEIKQGLVDFGNWVHGLYKEYIAPMLETFKEFFNNMKEKVRKFFGGDSKEFDQLEELGFVKDGVFRDKINRDAVRNLGVDDLNTILKEADQLSDKDQQYLRDLIAAKQDNQPAGQEGNQNTANAMEENAAEKSENEKGGGTTNNNAQYNNNSQTDNSTNYNLNGGGTNTNAGASYDTVGAT